MTSASRLLSPESLRGKTAAVTGSTSGIGLAVAEALASAGCNVALSGLGDPAANEALRARLEADHGVKVTLNSGDLSKPAEVRAYIEDAIAAFGAVDILVNNAGVQHVSAVEDFPDDRWELILALNLSAAFYATKAALPGMKARGWGRIINIASAHGLVASPFKSAYVAAKHGLIGFTRTVALECAETGITCTAICPGYVNTPLVQGQIRDQAVAHNMSEDRVVREVILAAQPSKRFVEPAEIAATVLFLCSPAGASITGVPLSLDGGWTAR
ncbi:3-hydroxybutyrate dehydrogenase [Pedomonas sp. V897]|uniref:3-hydroxybutyrate dehydrogenase n=1 Tax=Pedomonas sp. V897 TaxID=3446482 RepID=UPI003EE1C25F